MTADATGRARLKRCPFLHPEHGGVVSIANTYDERWPDAKPLWYFVRCSGCDTSGMLCLTEDEAVAAWNRRAEALASEAPRPDWTTSAEREKMWKHIESEIRALHHYGYPPDPRLQERVDNDVHEILADIEFLVGGASEAGTREPEYRAGEEEDEIVCDDFHMERMSDKHIWFVVGGEAFDLTSKKRIKWQRQGGDWKDMKFEQPVASRAVPREPEPHKENSHE